MFFFYLLLLLINFNLIYLILYYSLSNIYGFIQFISNLFFFVLFFFLFYLSFINHRALISINVYKNNFKFYLSCSVNLIIFIIESVSIWFTPFNYTNIGGGGDGGGSGLLWWSIRLIICCIDNYIIISIITIVIVLCFL